MYTLYTIQLDTIGYICTLTSKRKILPLIILNNKLDHVNTFVSLSQSGYIKGNTPYTFTYTFLIAEIKEKV